MVKTVSYEHQNTYEMLYPVTSKTTQIWVCFHGLGYLATYFKRYFTGFNKETCAVIVLQAPAKSYLGKDFKHVGACWLTKVDTQQEMQNNLNYITTVLQTENIYGDPRIVLMGYSQGVSIATRFFAQYHHPITALIMHSGSIPAELNEETAKHYATYCHKNIHIVGTQDEYLNEEVITREKNMLELLFGTKCELYRPVIKHEVAVTLLEQLAVSL